VKQSVGALARQAAIHDVLGEGCHATGVRAGKGERL
jgi:hypothetical protein